MTTTARPMNDATIETLTPLGATWMPHATRFGVFARADGVRVRLMDPGTRRLVVAPLSPSESEPGVWEANVEGDYRGWSYSYEIERDGQTLAGILDPRARLVHGDRAFIVHDEHEVVPRPSLDPANAIIYELHVRDFTHDLECGVRPQWRGRYPGLAQRGTRFDATDIATGLDHILELGVNVVQLMPVHSFAMPYDPAYEWGYMPNDFFAPHAGYASSVDLLAPIREMKLLVSALHEAGLRVTLDVVFNHTNEKWPVRKRSFMALAPHDYYRFKESGEPWDGSACGNEFRSESPQGRRFIIDCCKYWVTEFGVDGFRFDLMGLIDTETMAQVARELHAIDPTILVYGEPWAAGPTPIEVNDKGRQRGRGWGVFNDELRDAVRGEVFEPDDLGFIACGEDADRMRIGILGGVGHFADSPMETINYIECHDNHTLADRIALARPKGDPVTEHEQREMNKLGVLILLTSQGIPFLHSGQEFGRTKRGEENSYNLGDVINNIRWSDKRENAALYGFYRNCVRLRKEHPMFRLSTREQIGEAIRFFHEREVGIELPAGVEGYVLRDVTGRDDWERAVILFNGLRTDTSAPIPGGVWSVAVAGGVFEDGERLVEESIELRAHSGAVLFRRRSA